MCCWEEKIYLMLNGTLRELWTKIRINVGYLKRDNQKGYVRYIINCKVLWCVKKGESMSDNLNEWEGSRV